MVNSRFCLRLGLVWLTLATVMGAARPNVLMISIDDLNDWVGFMGGHPQVQTPHMDRLAGRGTAFLNAHCQSPLCNPSRTSLLLGLRPSTTGVYALDPWFRTAPQLRDKVTLPQYFAKQGYATLTTGKIFHDAYPPPPQRADGSEFTVWGYHGNMGPYPDQKFVPDASEHKLLDWGVYPTLDPQQEDWKVADWAIDQLKSMPEDKPFFLSVGLRRPHVPCYATKEWFDLYPLESVVLPPVRDDDRDDLPRYSWYLHWTLPEPRLSWLREHDQWRPLVRAYLACVSFVDSQVGRLIEALDHSPHRDNTLIVLWSDHGWHIGEKGMTGKTTLWERSTRVPMIFAGKGIAARARCTRPAELLDLYPTLVELAGLPAQAHLEGHSLLPLLRDASAPRAEPAITTHGPGNHAVRSEKWRYIRYADDSEELYDMSADPNEWVNLASRTEHASTKEELARWLPKTSAQPVPGSKTRLVELREGKVYWEGAVIPPDAAPR